MLQVAACQFVGVYKPEKTQLDASCYTLVLDNVPPKKQQKGSHVIPSPPTFISQQNISKELTKANWRCPVHLQGRWPIQPFQLILKNTDILWQISHENQTRHLSGPAGCPKSGKVPWALTWLTEKKGDFMEGSLSFAWRIPGRAGTQWAVKICVFIKSQWQTHTHLLTLPALMLSPALPRWSGCGLTLSHLLNI